MTAAILAIDFFCTPIRGPNFFFHKLSLAPGRLDDLNLNLDLDLDLDLSTLSYHPLPSPSPPRNGVSGASGAGRGQFWR